MTRQPPRNSRPTPAEAQLAAYNRFVLNGEWVMLNQKSPSPGTKVRIAGEAFIKDVPTVVVNVDKWGLVPVEQFDLIDPQPNA